MVLGGHRPWPSRWNLTWKLNFTSCWACPHDSLAPVLARITKFEPEMHFSTVKIPIVLGVDRPWPSRSNLTLKSKFIPFWACLHDKLSSVQARITKFGPEMHINTVRITTDFGLHKPSASLSFYCKSFFLTYLHCFCIPFSETSL